MDPDITLFISLILSLFSFLPLLLAQQPYIGTAYSNCRIQSNTSSVLGYTCNGQRKTCQSYLIFRSKPPFDSVYSISTLLASDQYNISQLNSVNGMAIFPRDKEVIVPVNCSCSGEYYQADSSYVVARLDTQFLIANYTYQGLTTCQAVLDQNKDKPRILFSGRKMRIPLRCPCPTRKQSNDGVKFLLTYSLKSGDTVSVVGSRFNVDPQVIFSANELSVENSTPPFTTLLIPLQNLPNMLQTIEPPPPPSVSSPGKLKWKKWWVFVVIGSVATVISFTVYYIFCRSRNLLRKNKKKKKKKSVRRKKNVHAMSVKVVPENYLKPHHEVLAPEKLMAIKYISEICPTLKVYEFEELQSATDHFCAESTIKGSLYRGLLDASLVAIKRIDGDPSTEFDILSKVNHFNLIRLTGVCLGQGKWYLVFEYAEKGVLSDWIHEQSGDKFLSWRQRIQIVLDVANGLNYLHNYTEPSHLHMDLTSNSILLTKDFRAKIANFDTSKITKREEDGVAWTRHVTGTIGYMAPEYLDHGLVSPNLDIYALGVVVLEIISGKKAVRTADEGHVLLSKVFIDLLSEQNAEEKLWDLVDPYLKGNCPFDLVLTLLRLTENCLKKDPACRPSVEEIVWSLSRIWSASLTWEPSNSDPEIQVVEDG